MIIQHNIAAVNAHRQLSGNNNIVSKNLEKLSSGFRINKAGDDAAGLAISEKMRAQIKGLERASSNAQDGISLIQTAEGALTEVHSMLNRMVELSVQSANGTYKDDVDRDALQSEVDSLTTEIDRVAKATNFNGINLIDGSLGSSTAKITKSAAAAAGVTFKDVDATKGTFKQTAKQTTAVKTAGKGDYYELTVNYEVNGKSQSTVVRATQEGNTALKNDDILSELSKALKNSELGSMFEIAVGTAGLEFTAKEAGLGAPSVMSMTGAVTTKATGAKVIDTKTAGTRTAGTDAKTTVAFGSLTPIAANASKETIENNTVTINGQKFAYAASAAAAKELGSDINVVIASAANTAAAATMSALIEQKTGVKASSNTTTATSIDVTIKNTTGGGGSGLELQVGDTNEGFNKVSVSVDDMSASGLGINAVDVSTKGAAGAAQQIVKDAINKVSTNRGNLGALQNRLEHTISNLGVTTENMTAAESRVRDVDMAKEMMMFTKNNVLTQAAQAMLAQANQQPQGVLQLLR